MVDFGTEVWSSANKSTQSYHETDILLVCNLGPCACQYLYCVYVNILLCFLFGLIQPGMFCFVFSMVESLATLPVRHACFILGISLRVWCFGILVEKVLSQNHFLRFLEALRWKADGSTFL